MSTPVCAAQNKLAKDFFKKRQDAKTRITEIQIFSKALWAFWNGL